MHQFTKRFADYCEQNFDIQYRQSNQYKSLSVCLIDCVYSLRARYFAVTIPVVDRYAAAYMNGDRDNSGDTVSMLLSRIEEAGGPNEFAEKVLQNHQKLAGNIPKEQVCYKLAQYLKLLHIDTLEDFQGFESQELLEVVIRSVKGIGDAGANYLFMLAGDPNRCKPDVHIHRCIVDVCGCDISNEECQVLFSETVEYLNKKYPDLTVRQLDGIIWTYYQSRNHR